MIHSKTSGAWAHRLLGVCGGRGRALHGILATSEANSFGRPPRQLCQLGYDAFIHMIVAHGQAMAGVFARAAGWSFAMQLARRLWCQCICNDMLTVAVWSAGLACFDCSCLCVTHEQRHGPTCVYCSTTEAPVSDSFWWTPNGNPYAAKKTACGEAICEEVCATCVHSRIAHHTANLCEACAEQGRCFVRHSHRVTPVSGQECPSWLLIDAPLTAKRARLPALGASLHLFVLGTGRLRLLAQPPCSASCEA